MAASLANGRGRLCRVPKRTLIRASQATALALLLIVLYNELRTNSIRYIDYDSSVLVTNVTTGCRIPRRIHQTYKYNETLAPPHWRVAQQQVKQQNRDYEYMFWTDDNITEFMNTHYPWFMDTFRNYRYPIQRVDAFRYFVLYHYGGIYVDLDIGARRPFDVLLAYGAVLAKTSPIGFSNDLMASSPKHAFMGQLIHALSSANVNYLLPSLTVIASTGPLFVTRQYHKAHKRTVSDVMIMDEDMYSSREAIVFHIQGNSWLTEDAKFFAWLWYEHRSYIWICLSLVLLCLLGFIALYRYMAR